MKTKPKPSKTNPEKPKSSGKPKLKQKVCVYLSVCVYQKVLVTQTSSTAINTMVFFFLACKRKK
jgi:hypothetical protein